MRTNPIRSGLVVAFLLAGCAGTLPGNGSQDPSPSPTPACAAATDELLADDTPVPTDANGAPCPGGGGGGGAGGGGGGGGGGSNTAIRTWIQAVDRSEEGFSDHATHDYRAVMHLTLTLTDAPSGSYAITGTADVTSVYTDRFNGGCKHFTDDASGSGTVDVSGGMEARDGAYEINISIPGLYGSVAAVRDESSCGGPNTHDTNEWPVAPMGCGGTGTYSDPHHIVGSSVTPLEGGEDKCTWDLVLP